MVARTWGSGDMVYGFCNVGLQVVVDYQWGRALEPTVFPYVVTGALQPCKAGKHTAFSKDLINRSSDRRIAPRFQAPPSVLVKQIGPDQD